MLEQKPIVVSERDTGKYSVLTLSTAADFLVGDIVRIGKEKRIIIWNSQTTLTVRKLYVSEYVFMFFGRLFRTIIAFIKGGR